MDSRAMRRKLLAHRWIGLRVVWPILSGLLAVMMGLCVAVGPIESGPLRDSLHFAFISGLRPGHGHLVPKRLVTRALAVGIGMKEVLLTGLIAAVGVQALLEAMRRHREP
jgi:hypothetical protein